MGRKETGLLQTLLSLMEDSFLMEHQVYREQAQGVILDAYGKVVVEECKKFDDMTKQKIHEYVQNQIPLNSVSQLKQNGKIRLEHYQKFYQNGTYERSRESGIEANYNMIDGIVNNQKKRPEKISDTQSKKGISQTQQKGKTQETAICNQTSSSKTDCYCSPIWKADT